MQQVYVDKYIRDTAADENENQNEDTLMSNQESEASETKKNLEIEKISTVESVLMKNSI